jgi:cutinase
MKVTQTLLPLAALVGTALSAPTSVPAEGASFPITDLLDSDLTVDEYAQSLESGSLTKRQYNGDTFNQLTDGTACRPVTVIFARGTTSPGNVGAAGSEGPTFFNALASSLGGASKLAIQGVNYAGMLRLSLSAVYSLTSNSRRRRFPGWRQRCWRHYHVQLDQHCEYCAREPSEQILILQAASKCPSTKIVVSGYSQGAQLVHTATQRLSAAQAARVSAGQSLYQLRVPASENMC